jgi:hypothetical protein
MTAVAAGPPPRTRAPHLRGVGSRPLRTGDRGLAVVCLLVGAGAHVPLIPAHWQEARYAGVAFVIFTVASLALAVVVAGHDTVAVWAGVAALEVLAITAYVVTRTVALPRLGDDVGSWLEPLSFPALAAELIAVVVAVSVLVRARAMGEATAA